MIKFLKKYTVFILLMTVVILETQGQAPGLSGKRLTFGYDVNFSFNFYGVAIDNADESTSSSFGDIVSLKHDFNLDYALSRSLSIGVDYAFAKNGIESFTTSLSNNVKMTELGIQLKHFHGSEGGIAPIGFYTQYRLFQLNYKTEIVPSENINNSEVYEAINRNAYGFSLAYGHQGILVSNIMYNIGFESGICFSDFDTNYQVFQNEWNILYSTRDTVNWNTLLKFKLGILVPII